MKFSLDRPAAINIRRYETGEITVVMNAPPEAAGTSKVLRDNVLISAAEIVEDWTRHTVAQLQADDFKAILAMQPELVIIGTGATLCFPAREVLQPFYQARIGVEVMNTAAACRTYNILVAEGRHAVAALLLT